MARTPSPTALKSPAPLLIALPHGLNVSGVTVWAVRLAGELARAGRRVALLLHPEPPGQRRLELESPRGVELIEPAGMPAIDAARGGLWPFIPHYRDAVRRLAAGGGPVVLSPNIHGDCYGVGAALCVAEPELVRMVGVQHADIEYDARVLEHYQAVIGRFIGVSGKIAGTLRARLGRRGGDVMHLAHGVPVLDRLCPREPLTGRPLRLLYTGRIEHAQKRVTALVALSAELSRRGVPHTLTLVGDGPACAEIDAALAGRDCIRRLPPVAPPRLGAMLDQADIFILASRYEGLSLSLLEAMAHGCVPVIARTESGAAEAVDPGVSGEIVVIEPGDDDAGAARALADAALGAVRRGLPGMSRAAWGAARDRFNLERYAGVFSTLIDELAATDPRPWPADRPCAFSSGDAPGRGSGSVPPDGAARLRAVLESLAGRRVVIHGAGQHTIQLASVLAASPAKIAAFTDDDPAKVGQSLWGWPIIAPAAAVKTGATDAVISSWMHEGAIWAGRDVYERCGMTVHRVYESAGVGRAALAIHQP